MENESLIKMSQDIGESIFTALEELNDCGEGCTLKIKENTEADDLLNNTLDQVCTILRHANRFNTDLLQTVRNYDHVLIHGEESGSKIEILSGNFSFNREAYYDALNAGENLGNSPITEIESDNYEENKKFLKNFHHSVTHELTPLIHEYYKSFELTTMMLSHLYEALTYSKDLVIENLEGLEKNMPTELLYDKLKESVFNAVVILLGETNNTGGTNIPIFTSLHDILRKSLQILSDVVNDISLID